MQLRRRGRSPVHSGRTRAPPPRRIDAFSFSVATAVETASAPRIMTRADNAPAANAKIGMRQFAEHQRSPRQSPHLVRVGKRNAASDAEVLGCELLEQIADHPDESAEEKPEQQVPHFAGVEDRGVVPPSRARTSANIVPSSPTVKTVTNESGFMPLI